MVNYFLSVMMMCFGLGAPVNFSNTVSHPIYVSVAEIEHNAKEQTLQVSYKIFTDDFEKTLRNNTNLKVDLINPKNREQMNTLVNDYLQKHFTIKTNGKATALNFLGFEEIEEGIFCYLEAEKITNVKTVQIFNNVLYEYHPQQMGIFHCKVNGITKSSKLNNPDTGVTFTF